MYQFVRRGEDHHVLHRNVACHHQIRDVQFSPKRGSRAPVSAVNPWIGSKKGIARCRKTSITLSDADRIRLERIKTAPQSLLKRIVRADIVLHLGSGHGLARDSEEN